MLETERRQPPRRSPWPCGCRVSGEVDFSPQAAPRAASPLGRNASERGTRRIWRPCWSTGFMANGLTLGRCRPVKNFGGDGSGEGCHFRSSRQLIPAVCSANGRTNASEVLPRSPHPRRGVSARLSGIAHHEGDSVRLKSLEMQVYRPPRGPEILGFHANEFRRPKVCWSRLGVRSRRSGKRRLVRDRLAQARALRAAHRSW